MIRKNGNRFSLGTNAKRLPGDHDPIQLNRILIRRTRSPSFFAAIPRLLIGGEYGSSLGFYPEGLCKSSFRRFREPLRRMDAAARSPSTHRLVRAWLIRSSLTAPPLRCLGLSSARSRPSRMARGPRPPVRDRQANRVRAGGRGNRCLRWSCPLLSQMMK